MAPRWSSEVVHAALGKNRTAVRPWEKPPFQLGLSKCLFAVESEMLASSCPYLKDSKQGVKSFFNEGKMMAYDAFFCGDYYARIERKVLGSLGRVIALI